MEYENTRLKHDIFVGQAEVNGALEGEFQIGYAFKYQDQDYYLIKLWPFPGGTYYLSKNRDNERYTVFSKLVETTSGIKFQNPVGYAQLIPDMKDYVEICLRLPKQRVYMSLYPSG